MGILQSHNTPISSFHFFHAAAILAFTSSSLPPWAWITQPSYMKFANYNVPCKKCHPILSCIFHCY